jgi:hypothetical protein
MSILSKYSYIFLIGLIYCGCNTKQKIYFSEFSPQNNLAYNNGYSLYPNPLESDKGWGGASFKWQIIDGIRTKKNYWNYGLAFTGGKSEYIDTCGWRQATINFGMPVKYNRVVIWLNKYGELPDSFRIMNWDDMKSRWILTKSVVGKRQQVKLYFSIFEQECEKMNVAGVIPYEEVFPEVKSSKLRFIFNNCGIDHGWINEIEVYCDSWDIKKRDLIIDLKKLPHSY